ncbi:MAG: hypothetical protein A3B68_02910 [Candidatus Melainabacteria bacterium RIFCSPHIGHO2_02_FULL_34_12]|nr:MAG: hypothetical protein A3B68_02910 [Candidatus Melainabacteria bacterium RIFCSPHIGHO2_02_FULL_34_12]
MSIVQAALAPGAVKPSSLIKPGARISDIPVKNSDGSPLDGYAVFISGNLSPALTNVGIFREPFKGPINFSRETNTKTVFLYPSQLGLSVLDSEQRDVSHDFIVTAQAPMNYKIPRCHA